RSSGLAPALVFSLAGEGRRLRGLSPKDACSSPRAGRCRLGPGATARGSWASPLLLGKTSSLSQRVSFLSQRVHLFLAKSGDFAGEWARFRKNKLTQSASELTQSLSELISGKVPGLFHWVSSA